MESAERWLLRCIVQSAGGDLSTASLITGRTQPVAKTMTHYGSISIDEATGRHSKAVRHFDTIRHVKRPSGLGAYSIGDPETPTDQAVIAFIESAREANRRAEGLSAKHQAMMQYTCGLAAFALALRGAGTLPGIRAVDLKTGFLQVHDKDFERKDKVRLVWACKLLLSQLRSYHEHVGKVHDALGSRGQQKLKELMDCSTGSAPLFRVVGPNSVRRLELSQVLKSLKELRWPGRENAGRHWLRSKLTDRCSGETLSAFYGHWQSGVDPWGASSALDPMVYRADLKRVLDPILGDVGWRPLSTRVA